MKVVNYLPEPEGAFGIARFDVELDPSYAPTLRRFRLVKSKKGTLYFTEPPYCVDDANTGEKTWVKYFEFTKEEKARLEKEILPLIEPHYKLQFGDSPTDDTGFTVDF